MSNIENVEDLKHTFGTKPEHGDKLPNPKDVADASSFWLKSNDTYVKHKMLNGSWYKEVVDSNSQVILQKV